MFAGDSWEGTGARRPGRVNHPGAPAGAKLRRPGAAAGLLLAALLALPLGVGCQSSLKRASDDAPPPSTASLECNGALGDGPALRRLTRTEFNNTVHDLLGDTSAPAAAFVPDPEVSGFRNNAEALNVTQLLASQVFTAADALARDTVTRRIQWVLPCLPSDGEACAKQFVLSIGKRAYRRPLTADEQASLTALFHGGASFEDGVRLVLQRLLISPYFLYRVEVGDRAAKPAGVNQVVPLTQYELATRLSYFLNQTMPDNLLLTEADTGRLDTPERLATQALRLLAKPEAQAMVDEFHDQWLGLSKVTLVPKDDLRFPQFTAAVRKSMAREGLLFTADVFWKRGDARALLSATDTFLDQVLATYYDAPRASGDGFTSGPKPTYQERAGVLSLGAVMATFSYADQISPVHRGKWVRNRLLCQELTPPPPTINATPPQVDGNSTLRQRWTQHSQDPSCAGCHRLTDPIGFGTSNIDAAGRWQADDNGIPIDASGEVVGLADGSFRGVAELGARLAGSAAVQACIARQWYRFALGRLDIAADQCTIDKLVARFQAAHFDARVLVTAIVQSDAFRYRTVVAPATDGNP